MTWTYNGDPSTSDRDAIRYLVGDTDTTDQQTTDEEIAWILTEEPNVYFAAARAARTISAKFARKADKTVGDLSIKYSQSRDHYDMLAKDLEVRGAVRAGSVYAGGISKTDKETVEEDDDRVKPSFKRGIHDAPGSDYSSSDPIDEV